MTRFTDSPYEKMMQQVPTERREVHEIGRAHV